jgi:hypothetical protein
MLTMGVWFGEEARSNVELGSATAQGAQREEDDIGQISWRWRTDPPHHSRSTKGRGQQWVDLTVAEIGSPLSDQLEGERTMVGGSHSEGLRSALGLT